LVQHWAVVLGGWQHDNRSLVKAGRVVRSMAMTLALAIRRKSLLKFVLSDLLRSVAAAGRINKTAGPKRKESGKKGEAKEAEGQTKGTGRL
jgi:hypothetical protein